MIGVSNPLPPLCHSCGAVVDYEPEDISGACNPCFFESEAKAHEELLRDYRWHSRDWFRCDWCQNRGEWRDGYCHCRKGHALGLAEEARFAFVKGLPALAVTSARHMRETDINPQTRIAK